MIREKIAKLVSQAVTSLREQKNWPALDFGKVETVKSENPKFGDYATNIAFILAKQIGQSPNEIAQLLVEELGRTKIPEVSRVEVAGGYINFFLDKSFLHTELERIHKKAEKSGRSDVGKGHKVIVEYSQPNIAKIMHIGHLRTTTLGDALANIFEFLGYKVIRWNYLGDWGTQFGKLITAYKLWGDKEEVARDPIKTLLGLYVRFHRELKEHPELDKRGQEEFKKLEDGDKENKKLWEWFKKESLKEFEKTYKLLNIKFDIWIGEAFFEKDLKPLIDNLVKRGIAETGEGGALIINLDKYNLPPALIRKADGASLYLTRDIANLKYRIAKYKPARIMIVVGNEQTLHFEQLRAVAEILGWPKPDHVKYGLVLGENRRKMATREGEAIPLEEVINKAIGLAQKIVEEKNPELAPKDKSKIAKSVAIGALKYEMLKDHRNSDIIFDWQRMLDFSGNSSPYLQYTYARLKSILRKAGLTGQGNASRPDFSKLVEESELAIIKHLLDFPDVVSDSGRLYLTNNLALYLYELANMASRFYEKVPVIKDEDTARRTARLTLIETVATVLQTGLGLLGIKALEEI